MHFHIYMAVHGQVYTNCNAHLAVWLVRKDIDVNDYGRLYNFTLDKNKSEETTILCCSTFHSYSKAVNHTLIKT